MKNLKNWKKFNEEFHNGIMMTKDDFIDEILDKQGSENDNRYTRDQRIYTREELSMKSMNFLANLRDRINRPSMRF